MKYKIGMISLGCAKNRVDAEMLLFTLRQSGHTIINEPEFADIVIVNTCGFIESAKQESINEIIELGDLKKEGKIKAIIVTGCLAERYNNEVLKELYEVDAVVGIGCNKDISKIVDDIMINKKRECYTAPKNCLPLEGGRIQSTPYYYAYLKVAEGCNNRCAYCAIPLIRGEFRSRKIENLVEEAKTLTKNGVKELIVIAQDTTKYGEDIYGKSMLPELLKELSKIDELQWIRLLYCYPDKITDELLKVMAEEEKILKYIDIPIQHCSKNVLRSMNRSGDKESLTKLVSHIREMVPNVILRTTLIVGFPGETEEDFVELAEFAKEARFERLGCFTYSKEEDTPAYDFDNQIDEEIKEKRQQIIMEQQQYIMDDFNAKLIDQVIDVIVEGFDEYAECYYGRSKFDSPDVDGKIFFSSDKPLSIGSIIKVKITDTLDSDPLGHADF